MSTKDTFYSSKSLNICAYQDITLENVNNNPVYLEVEEPEEFEVAWENGRGIIKLAMSTKAFDGLAIA